MRSASMPSVSENGGGGSTFDVKMTILPRQARDKHRGKAQKKTTGFSGSLWGSLNEGGVMIVQEHGGAIGTATDTQICIANICSKCSSG
jgi:hypothetical protein